MDPVKHLDKRVTRLGHFLAGSGDIADFEVQSPEVIPSQKDSPSNQRTSDKKAKTLHKSLAQNKVPQVSKPPKKVAFADLPVIAENPETTIDPKEHIEDNVAATSPEHDQPDTSRLERHFEPYYKITLGRHFDVQVARTKPAFLDEKQTRVFFWSLSGSESKDQVSVVRKIENKNFVKGIGVYTMPTPGEFIVAYEFMPVSLAEIAASRKVRGPELAYILKQILDGLLYLEELDMGHPELSCSNVLLDTSGGQHFCSYGTTDNLVTGFWEITAELMNGYVKKDMRGDHLDYAKWTAYPEAVDFYKFLETLNNAPGDER
ncbi:hypothetical protein FMUND_119 [Fusarium mundagurra]|uniref:Protein kinase domain-containing protein n=1 Tax=Fusarium mundagurra TaxID=1567541 RepID=A0A8H6DPW5_9HYPO|nr:hypothetical protein FMUND_119 [Fusarium mundagurra]